MEITFATYNLNNLFRRAKLLQLEGFSPIAKKVLNDIRDLNVLLEKDSYQGNTGAKIVEILETYFGEGSKEKWFTINQVRGKLYKIKRDKAIELVAKGKEGWFGWVELDTDEIDSECVRNTARVIQATKADVMCVVEVEDRITLNRFNEYILKDFDTKFAHNMVIDGNDDRGIDVGVLSKYEIALIKSHIDDTYIDGSGKTQKIFSRDCPEYTISLPNDQKLFLLCNHFKSKGYGSPASSNAKREKQAIRVKEILGKYDLTKDFVVVAGDFNDTPESQPLQPLLNTDKLFDVLSSNKFSGEKWTYRDGNQQIDYVLVSKPIFDNLKEVGIERRGILKRGNPHFDEVTNQVNQASDHAAIWASFSI
jgi:endonuclease/exonuclease/phosphatase family metal-dependent hydrolase